MKELILEVLNSPSVIILIGTIGLMLLRKARSSSEKVDAFLDKYAGRLIDAVKFAEKHTNEGTKIDTALDYLIKVIESTEKRTPKPKEVGLLREGLTQTHSILEKNGELPK